MPTFEVDGRFWRDYESLTDDAKLAFLAAKALLAHDLRNGLQPRPSLRVKRVQRSRGVWEVTWAPDGRATFEYGRELIPGQAHIVWRRIGDHGILNDP